MSALEARGLAKSYAGVGGNDPLVALRDVSLELGAGEFVSLVGPSGCGKSTLLRILAGLVPASAGEILLGGGNSDALLGRVGYMPQEDLLMPWRTTLDNVTIGLELAGVSRADARG
ncbi:MAG TPA: ATP-binding cassette domain-containing protein, partial [Solirubrobacteraceae bacterium]|nr:ATP-binding cassette domain-containing protein [Solirubrobacteraceae bacterium]